MSYSVSKQTYRQTRHKTLPPPASIGSNHIPSCTVTIFQFSRNANTYYWLRCTVAERRSLTVVLSLSHARPVADG